MRLTWHRQRPARAALAFTLMELMLAMFVLSLLLAGVYSSWSAIVRASKIGQNTAVEVQRTRVAIRAIIDSLLTVQMYGANTRFYSFEADTSGSFATVSFVSRLPASFLDSGLFHDQIVRRVTFVVEPGPEGNQLVMYQMPFLAVESSEQKPFPIVLTKDVSQFTMDFWDGKANKWREDWNNTNALPKIVRVSLGVGHSHRRHSEPAEVYTRVVSLPSIVIPREYQLSAGGGTNRMPLPPINQPPVQR